MAYIDQIFLFDFQLLPQALRIAMEEDLDFRKGLPIGYLNHVGVSNSDKVLFDSHF